MQSRAPACAHLISILIMNYVHKNVATRQRFKKAFDTVNHKLLFEKLSFYGERGIANTWLENYLMNRKQYVVVDNQARIQHAMYQMWCTSRFSLRTSFVPLV